MNIKIIILSFLFFGMMLADYGYSLDGTYMYVSLSYGRGWWPWACLMEEGVTMEEVPFSINHLFFHNFCKARECPFEAVAMTGYACSQKETVGFVPAWGILVEVTIPTDVKLVDSYGYVIDDEVCVGDKFKLLKSEDRGEWWQRGGHEDSPPIYWVDDVEELFLKMLDYHEKTNTPRSDVILSLDQASSNYYDGYVDPLFKIPIYTIQSQLHHSYIFNQPVSITGNLICSLKSKDVAPLGPIKFDGEYYTSSGVGSIDFNVNTAIQCMYYHFGSTGGYGQPGKFYKFNVPTIIQAGPRATVHDWGTHNIKYKSIEDFFKIGEISFERNINILPRNVIPPEISHSYSERESSPIIAKINISNDWYMPISITNVYSDVNHRLLVCDKEKVGPGENAECILEIRSSGVFGLFLDYEYETCGGLKEGTINIKKPLPECYNDRDCPKNYICCEGLCRDSTKGICADIDADGINEWIHLD